MSEREDPVRGGGHRQCCLLHEGLETNGVWERCVFHNPRWVSWKRADTAVHLMRTDMETILFRVPAKTGPHREVCSHGIRSQPHRHTEHVSFPQCVGPDWDEGGGSFQQQKIKV